MGGNKGARRSLLARAADHLANVLAIVRAWDAEIFKGSVQIANAFEDAAGFAAFSNGFSD